MQRKVRGDPGPENRTRVRTKSGPSPGAPTFARMVLPFSLPGIQRTAKAGAPADATEHEAAPAAGRAATGPASSRRAVSRLDMLQRQVTEKRAREDVHGDTPAAAEVPVSIKGGAPARRNLGSSVGVDLGGVPMPKVVGVPDSSAARNASAFTHKSDQPMAHEATKVAPPAAAPAVAPTPSGIQVVAPALSGASAAATAHLPTASPALSPSLGAAPGAGGGPAAQKVPASPGGALAPAASAKVPARAAPAKGGGPGAETAAAPAGAPEAAGQKRRALSPQSDPAFLSVVQHVKSIAAHQKTHAPAASKALAAHAAVVSPSNEVPSRAAAKHTDAIEKVQPKPFNRDDFRTALMRRIADTAPKKLKDADDFENNNNLGSVKQDLNSEVGKSKKDSQAPVADKVAEPPDATGIEPTPTTPLPAPEVGGVPQVSAAQAAPKPASDADISLQAGPQQVDQEMGDANVTEEQLKSSNEPEFQSALGQKKELEKGSVSAPVAYRAQEPKLLHAAQAEAQTTASKHVAGFHGVRTHAFGGVASRQEDAKAEEKRQREKIFSDVEGKYQATKTKVEVRLQKLDKDVNDTFDIGAVHAQTAFETYVAMHMADYKDRRYGGWGGGALWLKDKFFDLPEEVNRFYEKGLEKYLSKMNGLIDRISIMVETGLNEAKGLINDGKVEIEKYLSDLEPQWKETGKQAANGIQKKFDALEQSVVDKQNQLIDSLAKKYNDNLQKVNDRIEQMKEENRGLVSKAVGAIKGVIQAIKHLKDLILNVLSRAAAAIGMIIAHPIRFLGNLVEAGILGFNNFKGRILEHLKEGFLKWLFGAAAATGIELPKSFDLAGIFSLVMQLLGLSRENIRARAVAILGEKTVHYLEGAAEIFKILISKGPSGLLEHLNQATIGAVLDMAIQKIKTFVLEEIVYAGITWLIGLLNPVSAFIKACKAIYSIVMFFVERGSQILDLVNAIIDAIPPIAEGKIAAAADFIENALARAIPVIIGFLASLLGVSGITDKIKEAIDAIRKPVNDAVDWVIHKAAAGAKKLFGAAMTGAGKLVDWFKAKLTISTDDGETHSLYFSGDGPGAQLMVASAPQELQAFLASKSAEAKKDPKKAAALAKIKPLMSKIRALSKLPEEKQRDRDTEFRTAFNAIGESLPILLGGGNWGTEENPLPIDYFKRPASAYPVLFFGPRSESRIPQDLLQAKAIAKIQGLLTKKENAAWKARGNTIHAYQPTTPNQALPDGGDPIGVEDQYQIAVGKKVEYTPGKTKGGGLINSNLRPYGYRAGKEQKDGDHVVEMQIGGPNILPNLWPLEKHENRSSGSKLAATKVSPEGKNMTLLQAYKKKKKDLWLVIVKTL